MSRGANAPSAADSRKSAQQQYGRNRAPPSVAPGQEPATHPTRGPSKRLLASLQGEERRPRRARRPGVKHRRKAPQTRAAAPTGQPGKGTPRPHQPARPPGPRPPARLPASSAAKSSPASSLNSSKGSSWEKARSSTDVCSCVTSCRAGPGRGAGGRAESWQGHDTCCRRDGRPWGSSVISSRLPVFSQQVCGNGQPVPLAPKAPQLVQLQPGAMTRLP